MNKIKIRILDEILSKHLQEIKAGHDGKLAQAIESLIKKSQLQLLKEVEKSVMGAENPYPPDLFLLITSEQWAEIDKLLTKHMGFRIDRVSGNLCRKGFEVSRIQIVKSIKELGEEL